MFANSFFLLRGKYPFFNTFCFLSELRRTKLLWNDSKNQTRVVRKVDNTRSPWIAIYSVDNVIHLSNNLDQAPVVQRVYKAIHRINRNPVGSEICFINTYPLDNDLSRG